MSMKRPGQTVGEIIVRALKKDVLPGLIPRYRIVSKIELGRGSWREIELRLVLRRVKSNIVRPIPYDGTHLISSDELDALLVQSRKGRKPRSPNASARKR